MLKTVSAVLVGYILVSHIVTCYDTTEPDNNLDKKCTKLDFENCETGMYY